MTVDNKTEPKDVQELKAEQLDHYLQGRKPDCEVNHRRDIDFGWRFYFVKDDKNAYIVDISRDLFADWSTEQIISILETAQWQWVLEANLKRIPYFTNAGIDFHVWPR